MKVVIIGNHAAGLSAAQTLRRGDGDCEILVISNEDVPPYSRCMIPYLVSGEKQVEDILHKPADFYESNAIETHFGVEAVKVLPDQKEVLLADGGKVGYDSLIIAAGGTPSLPRIPGIQNKGVFGFRGLQDAEKIVAYCENVRQAVVLGGGLVGLKAAVALNRRGVKVAVIVGSPNVLSQIVAAPEAEIFQEYLSELGIEIVTRTSPAGVLGKDKVEGVESTEGRKFPCRMVVVGKGVRANLDMIKDTAIQAEYGILVDDHCRTSVPDVYAAGDVAQSRDDVRKERWMNSLWPHAVEEGRVAAENILGKDTVLRSRTSMNSFVIGELALISCGLTGAREKVEGAEELLHKGPGKWDCKRFILKDGLLMGYAIVGNVINAGILTSLVTRGIDVSDVKEELISGNYDFAFALPLVRKNPDKFTEPEFQEVLSFL